MFNQIFITIILFAGFGIFTWSMYVKIKLLLKGKEENRFDNLRERVEGVVLYAFGQKKLFKEPLPGLMHALIFWGFCILLIRSILLIIHAFGYEPLLPLGLGPVYTFLKDITELVVTIVVFYAIFRRLFFRLERVTPSIDAYIILLLILILMITDFLFDGTRFAMGLNLKEKAYAPIGGFLSEIFIGGSTQTLKLSGEIFYWAHIITLFFFLNYLPYSKHFHVILSIPNVFFRNLKPCGALKPIENIENQESFGVGKVEDFTWKQLMDTLSCTECGRCSVNCPAHLTKKPLNPKLLIQDIKHHFVRKAPYLLGRKEGGDNFNLISDIKEDVIWSCTTCRSCEENCPVLITHTDKIIDMRRYLVLMSGKNPAELTRTMKNLETKNNPWGLPILEREKWAEGLGVQYMKDAKETEYLFFVGCASCYDDRNKRVAVAFSKILKKAGVNFAILGAEEICCGDPARRAGNEYLFQIQAKQNIEKFKSYNVKKIFTACPHCFNTIKNEYPHFGGEFEVYHHSEILSDFIKGRKIKVRKEFKERVAYHDSCYLGRTNGIYEQPRDILKRISTNGVLEIKRSFENGMCCGAGGARVFMEEKIGGRINHLRIEQAMEVSPSLIATACPFCLIMFRDGINELHLEEKLKAKDIAEIVIDYIE